MSPPPPPSLLLAWFLIIIDTTATVMGIMPPLFLFFSLMTTRTMTWTNSNRQVGQGNDLLLVWVSAYCVRMTNVFLSFYLSNNKLWVIRSAIVGGLQGYKDIAFIMSFLPDNMGNFRPISVSISVSVKSMGPIGLLPVKGLVFDGFEFSNKLRSEP